MNKSIELDVKLVIHKALSFINTIIALYCLMAGMHFTFNSYDGMSTNVVALICYAAAVYAFAMSVRYDKSIKRIERKIKNSK